MRKRSMKKSKSKSRKLKLLKIVKSPNKLKKYRAYFSDGKHTDFGSTGYSDFTKHRDPERKKRYISRHRSRENWKAPKTAGALSLYFWVCIDNLNQTLINLDFFKFIFLFYLNKNGLL